MSIAIYLFIYLMIESKSYCIKIHTALLTLNAIFKNCDIFYLILGLIPHLHLEKQNNE